MNSIKIVVIAIISNLIFSCTQHEHVKANKEQINKDPFYTATSGYDYIRFPLLKPYEVISLDKGREWAIKSDFKPKSLDEIVDANGIQQINILQKKIIICYCKGDTETALNIGNKLFSKAWFIFIPEQNINKGFTTEEEFSNYLQKLGIQKEQIEWKTPQELFEQFTNTHCLPWIPDCQ